MKLARLLTALLPWALGGLGHAAGSVQDLPSTAYSRTLLRATNAAASLRVLGAPQQVTAYASLSALDPDTGAQVVTVAFAGAPDLTYRAEASDPGYGWPLVATNAASGKFWVARPAHIDARWFGAVADGATDDTTALQASMNASASVQTPLKLDQAYMATTLHATNNLRVLGVGSIKRKTRTGSVNRAVLQIGDQWSSAYGVTNVTIEGITVDADSFYIYPTVAPDTEAHCVVVSGPSANVTFRNCTFRNGGKDGLIVFSSASESPSNVLVEDCSFWNNTRDHISVITGHGVTISRNVFSATYGQAAIDVEPDAWLTVPLRQITISENWFYQNPDATSSPLIAHDVRRPMDNYGLVTVSGNQFLGSQSRPERTSTFVGWTNSVVYVRTATPHNLPTGFGIVTTDSVKTALNATNVAATVVSDTDFTYTLAASTGETQPLQAWTTLSTVRSWATQPMILADSWKDIRIADNTFKNYYEGVHVGYNGIVSGNTFSHPLTNASVSATALGTIRIETSIPFRTGWSGSYTGGAATLACGSTGTSPHYLSAGDVVTVTGFSDATFNVASATITSVTSSNIVYACGAGTASEAYNAAAKVQFDTTKLWKQGTLVYGNTIDGSMVHGVCIMNSSNNVIGYNAIRSPGQGGAYRAGVYVDSTGCANNLVFGNQIWDEKATPSLRYGVHFASAVNATANIVNNAADASAYGTQATWSVDALTLTDKLITTRLKAVDPNRVATGNTRGLGSVDFQLGASSATNIASGVTSGLLAGTNNTAYGVASAVAGGVGNFAYGINAGIVGGLNNVASGSYASVLGGSGNTASGARALALSSSSGIASGDYAISLGGFSITASGLNSIAGGLSSQATKDYAIALQYANIASGTNSMASGERAVSPLYGQWSRASGRFAANGDGQMSILTARQTHTIADGVTTNLWLDGTANNRIVLPTNSTWLFRAEVLGRTITAGGAEDKAGYVVSGVISRDGATTAIVGSVTVTVIAESDAAWDCTATADDTNEALEITVTGNDETTIYWLATIYLTQISG